MSNLDPITAQFLGLKTYLRKLQPHSESAAEQWQNLRSASFLSPDARRDELSRRQRLDRAIERDKIADLGRQLEQLPTLQRVLRRLGADRVLRDADFFELKRFFYHGRQILDLAEGLDDLPTKGSALDLTIGNAMAAIHPDQPPSARFHLADELAPELAARRAELRDIRHRLRDRRQTLQDQIAADLEGRFDLQGQFHPAPESEPDDERLRIEHGSYRIDDPTLDELEQQRAQSADRVASVERDQRRRLTALIADELDCFIELHNCLVAFDIRLTCVELRRAIDGCWPVVESDRPGAQLTVNQGRDPALVETLDPAAVQAIDVAIDDVATVVIGPNMGGKSALLRLVGLAQWCAQMALPAPAQACTTTSVEGIVYIGSDQPGRSIDTADLSSFGREIRRFVDFWTGPTPRLWLLDEPGRGTHPEEGARLADEIASARTERGDTVIMATHFPSLADRPRFTRLCVAGLTTDDATLSDAIEDAAHRGQSLREVLRRFMDYRVIKKGDHAIPRDGRRIARALGLSLESAGTDHNPSDA